MAAATLAAAVFMDDLRKMLRKLPELARIAGLSRAGIAGEDGRIFSGTLCVGVAGIGLALSSTLCLCSSAIPESAFCRPGNVLALDSAVALVVVEGAVELARKVVGVDERWVWV